MSVRVDWSKRAEYIRDRHGIDWIWADEAVADEHAVWLVPRPPPGGLATPSAYLGTRLRRARS